ncbi:DMT family transporter [Cecembia calidifontis]|uniref:EamA-like transporter family protein n=1 Tax=Cecembia calidifontis TaxID=1187080 RepID=A0A4Q7PE14_9BACT|nr:DMT family transporter [Cecembia calidifontis]RZS98624.1 EamA-like transporter family protein [Cecembia calidifontis]
MGSVTLLIFAVLLRIFSNPFSNVIQKQLTVNQHPFFVNFISYAVLAILSLFLIVDFPLHQLPVGFWFYVILGGICGAFGNGFLLKALELGQLSVLGPIIAYKSLVGIVFGFVLLGEVPGIWGFSGIVLIIFGSYFVLKDHSGKFSWRLFRQEAILYRFLALLLTGMQAVFDKQVILHSNLTLAFASWCFFGALFSLPILFLFRVDIQSEWAKMNQSYWVKYFFLILSIGFMVMSTNYTFSQMQVGPALALFQLSILITVFFGYRFFQEKHLLRKIIGSLIMIGGSVLIILLN